MFHIIVNTEENNVIHINSNVDGWFAWDWRAIENTRIMDATMQTNLRGFQDLTKQVVPVTRCTPQAIKRLLETPKLTRTEKGQPNEGFTTVTSSGGRVACIRQT